MTNTPTIKIAADKLKIIPFAIAIENLRAQALEKKFTLQKLMKLAETGQGIPREFYQAFQYGMAVYHGCYTISEINDHLVHLLSLYCADGSAVHNQCGLEIARRIGLVGHGDVGQIREISDFYKLVETRKYSWTT